MSIIPLNIIRRTVAEFLACAVSELFSEVKLVKAHVTDLGFHYDFCMKQPIGNEMISLIEERLRGLLKETEEIKILEMMRENAIELFLHLQEPYKVKELELIPDNIVQVSKIGVFHDVCSFLPSEFQKFANSFKITNIQKISIQSPYLNEEEEKAFETLEVVRISGVACEDKKELKNFLKKLEEYKSTNHQVLGTLMGLYEFQDELSLDIPFWLPKGLFIRNLLMNFLKKEDEKFKFESVLTPNIQNASFLKKIVKQLPQEERQINFRIEQEGVDLVYTCEKAFSHALLFKSQERSGDELPIRYLETGEYYCKKYLNRGVGLLNTAQVSRDQAHIFCTEKEVVSEIISCLQLIDKTAKILGFEYRYILNTKKPKVSGIAESFNQSLLWLKEALNALKIEFVIDKELDNDYDKRNSELNFCGPSIELEIIDKLGRSWNSSFVGINLATREAFGLYYRDHEGKKQRPVMISRSIFRSLEQFIALLIERHAGMLPLYFSETQVKILPISERNLGYANRLYHQLLEVSIRSSVDGSAGKLGEKVHRAEKERVPYMLIVGDNEEKDGSIKVRALKKNRDEIEMTLDVFLKKFFEDLSSNSPSQTGEGKSVES